MNCNSIPYYVITEFRDHFATHQGGTFLTDSLDSKFYVERF